MSTETVEEMKPLLKEYVEKSSDIANLQWDERVTRKLPFDPYAKSPQISHYFLMVASIAETELIGRSENARALMIDLYAILGNTFSNQTNRAVLKRAFRNRTLSTNCLLQKHKYPMS